MALNEDNLTDVGIEVGFLTQRQQAILGFIQAYLEEHSRPPAEREIGRAVGLRSTSSVHYHVKRLVAMGYLGKQASGRRTLVLLKAGQQPLDEPMAQDTETELAALRAENQRLRAWCRQLERERAWERQQRVG